MPIYIDDTFSSTEYILMAMTQLTDQGKFEVTEWDITVATWTLNKKKFGLSGYNELFPDHKKVYIELIRKYANNTTGRMNILSNFIVKTSKPSIYAPTEIGLKIGRTLLFAFTTGDYSFLNRFPKPNRIRAMYDYYSKLNQEENLCNG